MIFKIARLLQIQNHNGSFINDVQFLGEGPDTVRYFHAKEIFCMNILSQSGDRGS